MRKWTCMVEVLYVCLLFGLCLPMMLGECSVASSWRLVDVLITIQKIAAKFAGLPSK